jgi:hypothetical protein
MRTRTTEHNARPDDPLESTKAATKGGQYSIHHDYRRFDALPILVKEYPTPAHPAFLNPIGSLVNEGDDEEDDNPTLYTQLTESVHLRALPMPDTWHRAHPPGGGVRRSQSYRASLP